MPHLAFFQLDWAELFVPDRPLLETVVRGTIVYLSLFALLRVVLKREAGAVGISDLLVIVLIADAVQNAMANEYKSITNGLVLVATIVFWDFAIDWLEYHVPALRPLFSPAPLPLVKDGKMNRRNMRKELLSEDELMSQLRQHGVDSLEQVKSACMESDGHVSVIRRDEEKPQQKPDDRKTL